MNSSQKAAGALEDIKIPTKLKLSALWAATLFLYAYGDIFGFFRPDVIESVKAGKIAGFQINQGFPTRRFDLHLDSQRDGLPDPSTEA